MAAIKRNTAIRALVFKVASKQDEEMRIMPLIHKSKSFETPRAALLDLAEAIKEEYPDILVANEPYYEDCCKPYIKQRKKHCADCGNGIEGLKLKDDKVDVSKELDEYELEGWIEGLMDTYSADVGNWQVDRGLKCLTELQPTEVAVVFDLPEVLTILLENKPKEMEKLFKNESARVIETSIEELDEDENDNDYEEEEDI